VAEFTEGNGDGHGGEAEVVLVVELVCGMVKR